MLIESEITQHLVNISKLEIVMIHFMTHFFDHITQPGNLENISTKLPPEAMMDHEQGYQHTYDNEAPH
jgi:hypothetical protein